jgi:putative glutamine amidotransferase
MNGRLGCVPVPLIAITTYPANEVVDRINLPVEYVESVRRAGGRALLVPPGEADPSGLLDAVDGLLLTGGGDIDPSRWDGPSHETVYQTSIERDDLELQLARLAVSRGSPMMCICRGVQVLNVALGGSLHVHVPDVVGEGLLHRVMPLGPVPHPIAVDADSQLARTMGTTDIIPMSWHHQAIDHLGEGLRVVARAPDGIVEAVELSGHPSLIAVQWHPELTAADDPTQAALFDAFVGAAASVHA